MIRLFIHYVPHAVLLLAVIGFVLLLQRRAEKAIQRDAGKGGAKRVEKEDRRDLLIRLQTLRVILWPEGAR